MPTNRDDLADEPKAEESPRADFTYSAEGGKSVGGEADVEIDLRIALGASVELSPQILRLYIPNKDRNGRRIWRQNRWVDEAANLFAKMGGGVTIMPPVRGSWINDESQKIIWERPVIVYAFIKPHLFRSYLDQLRKFLHRLGRETNQGEIAFEFDGNLYRIHDYDQG